MEGEKGREGGGGREGGKEGSATALCYSIPSLLT